MWAMFVLAHDCGHGSFSNHQWVNDIVGNILNSFILVSKISLGIGTDTLTTSYS